MYRPAAFEVEDAGALLGDLVGHAAATLVHHGAEGLTSTVLPLLFDPTVGVHGTLTGHVARGNPLAAEARAADGELAEVLVVVTGPEGYVSPSWYASKSEHGRVVPTWDYVTVEAAGPLRLHPEPEWLLGLVSRLTDRHEAERPARWAVSDAPDDYVAASLRGIVGIEVPITRLAAKAKLSQNRPAADVDGVVAGLRADGHEALAAAVERAARPDGG